MNTYHARNKITLWTLILIQKYFGGGVLRIKFYYLDVVNSLNAFRVISIN